MYSCCEEKRCWLFARPMSEKQIRQDITKKLQSNIQPASSASSVLPLADVKHNWGAFIVCSLLFSGENNIRSGYCCTLPKQAGKIRSTVITIFWQAKCHFVKTGYNLSVRQTHMGNRASATSANRTQIFRAIHTNLCVCLRQQYIFFPGYFTWMMAQLLMYAWNLKSIIFNQNKTR